MNDTSPEVETYLAGRFAALLPGERVAMACGMFSTAMRVARAGILAAEPGLDEPAIRLRLLQRFYGDELSQVVMMAVASRCRR
jgi:hypothetical protein